MNTKKFTDEQIAVKSAFRRAVQIAGGPSKIEAFVRVDAARLSRYGNPDCLEFPPLDVCIQVDRLAGDQIMLRAWANLAGCSITIKDKSPNALKDVTFMVGSFAREGGEAISTLCEAASDGKFTPNEARKSYDELADVIDSAIDLQAAVRPRMVAS